ncbi:hypothetical protein CLOP_g15594 [Closterium sp. NIES-67]|nr:hypothetical protein CLOP_g15594 [Closterium sp. NIES-67]
MDRHNFASTTAARRFCTGGAPRCQHTLAVLLASGSEFCPQCLSETLSVPGLATHNIISARFFLDTLRSEPDLCRLVASESHYLLAVPLVQAVACARDEELAATIVDLVVFLASKGPARGGGGQSDASAGDEGLLVENLVRAVAVEMDKIPLASATSGHCFLMVLLGKLLTVTCNRHSALPPSLAQQSSLWSHVVGTLHKQTQDSIRAESLFVLHKLCSLAGGMQVLEEQVPGIMCAAIAILLATHSNDVSANCVGLLTALCAPARPAFTLSSLAQLDHRPGSQRPGAAGTVGLGSQGSMAVGSQSQAVLTQGKEPLGLRVMLCEGLKKTLLAADSALQLAALHLISQLALSCAPSDDGTGSDGRSGFDWVARETWEEDWCKQGGAEGGDGGGTVDEQGAAALQAMLDEGLAEHIFELLRSTDTGLVADPLVPAALSCLLHLAASPGAAGQTFAQRFVFGFDTLAALLRNAIQANDFHLQALSVSIFLHALRSARTLPRGTTQFPPAKLHALASALAEVVRRFCMDARERKRWVLDQMEALSTACLALAVLATWQSITGAEYVQVVRMLEQCVGDAASILSALQDGPSTAGALPSTGGKFQGGASSALPAVASGTAGGTTAGNRDAVALAVLTFLHGCAQRLMPGDANSLYPAAPAAAASGAAALTSSQQDVGLLAMVGGSQGAPIFHSSQQEGAGRAAAGTGRTGGGGSYMRVASDKTQEWGVEAPSKPSTAVEGCVEDIAAALMAAADMHVAPFMLALHPHPQPPPGHMHAPQRAPPATAAAPFSDPAAILSRAYDVLSHVLACSLPSLAPVARQFAAKLASSWTLSLVFSSLHSLHPPAASSLAAPSWLSQSVAPQAPEISKWDVLRRASLRFAVLLSAVAATGEEGRPALQWMVGVAGLECMPWAVNDMVLLLAEGRGEADGGNGRRDMQWRYQGGGHREGGAGEEEEVQAVQWVVLLILYAAVQFDDRLVDYDEMFGALQSLVLSNRIPPLGSLFPALSSLAPSRLNHLADAYASPPTPPVRSTFFLLVFLALHALLRRCCSGMSFEADHRLLRFLQHHAAALSFPLPAWHVALPHWILLQDGLEELSHSLMRAWLCSAAASLQPPSAPGPSHGASTAPLLAGSSQPASWEAGKGFGGGAGDDEGSELEALGSLLCHDSAGGDESSIEVHAWNGEQAQEAERRCALVVAGVVREMWRVRGEWQQLAQVTRALATLVDRHPRISAQLEQGALSTMYIEAMLLSGSQLPLPLLLSALHLLARLLSHLPPKPPVPHHMGGRLQQSPPPHHATAWERLAQQVLIVVEPLVRGGAGPIAAANTLSQQLQQQQHYSQPCCQPQVHMSGGGEAAREQEESGEREQVLVGAFNVINALLWQATALYSAGGADPRDYNAGNGARSGRAHAVGSGQLGAVLSANKDVLNACVTIMSCTAVLDFAEQCITAAARGICGASDGPQDVAAAAGEGRQKGGCEVVMVQARGRGSVWQGYSCRVLLSCLTFFNLRVSWVLALEATSTLPSGIRPLNLALRFSPPTPQPAAAAESATPPATVCASQGDPSAPKRPQQQECPAALCLASASDFAAILLAAAAGQLPATLAAGSRGRAVGGAAGQGNGPGNGSGGHAASCPHPPVRRNTCAALSLLLRCFDLRSVARPLAASPWTRLLLDDALASITAAAAATTALPAAAGNSSGATANAAVPDAAAMRDGEMRPAGDPEGAHARSSCSPSPAMLGLLLSHALATLPIAAACLHLAPPNAPPRWLSHIFQPARVSALVGSLWRTRQLSLPALATCHRLIGAGLLPRSLLPQLLDLAQAHSRAQPQQSMCSNTDSDACSSTSTARLLWLATCLVVHDLPTPAALSSPCLIVMDPSLPATLPHQSSAFLALHAKVPRCTQ